MISDRRPVQERRGSAAGDRRTSRGRPPRI